MRVSGARFCGLIGAVAVLVLLGSAAGQERQSQQDRLRTGGPGGGLTPGFELPDWPAPPDPLLGITPVSDEMLANPPAGDWLTWRRTWDDLGFSPLDQIDRENVGGLAVAWTLTLPPGPNENTPLVHDGVLFVHSYGDNVQALDAVTGDELWHYARELPEGTGPSVKRNMALYSDRLYVGTSDLHVVALDVGTGNPVWDQPVAERQSGWNLTGGPLVARGRVMQGVSGGGPGGAYIQALDSETGMPVWRFNSIAQPGEPNGESWNGLPLAERTGGSVWTAGSYDPDLGLAFFGPAPTYNTGPLRDQDDDPATTNDALYTDTTVALDPATGELVWYYQHMANDQWDYDWAFERQVLELEGADGGTEKLVVTMGKVGILDAVEADSGRYVFSIDMGIQNFITAIDPVTGAKTYDPDLIPRPGRQMVVCPHPGGGKSWLPGSYNSRTQVLFMPVVESCMDLTPVEGGRGFMGSGARVSVRPRPDTDGLYGRVQAIDLGTRETLWTARQRAPQSTGVLATAGGVVFAGALDRWLTAYDDRNGEILWRIRLNDVPNSAPITFMVDGRQYLAATVGNGGAHPQTFAPLVPEIPLPVARSSTLWVFEVGE